MHNTYISATSFRYGSDEIKKVFSEFNKRRLLRVIWYNIAKAQSEIGLVNKEELKDLKDHIEDIDIDRALEIEKETKHDLMAEILAFGEKATKAKGIIHLGCTSMDILDAAETLRQKEALRIILRRLKDLLSAFNKRIKEYSNTPVLAFTHIQPAEITTLGYRLAQNAQDLLIDYNNIKRLFLDIKSKGIRGACGTAASFNDLCKGSKLNAYQLEDKILKALDLKAFTCSTQIYTRKQDHLILQALSALASSLSKFAFDLRILQSPLIAEISESFSKNQVGSSAMPFKRNPISSEKINSLARLIGCYDQVLWQDQANMILERTLDDSANRRIAIADSFILSDEILSTALRLVNNMVVDELSIKRNLDNFGPFSATEKVLLAACKKGADRQLMHHYIKECSLKAYEDIRLGKPNPIIKLISEHDYILKFLDKKEILSLFDISNYYGQAADRSLILVDEILLAIKENL